MEAENHPGGPPSGDSGGTDAGSCDGDSKSRHSSNAEMNMSAFIERRNEHGIPDARSALIVPEGPDFEEPETFLTKQKALRQENIIRAGGQKVMMLSHCWRDPSTQESKRKLIAALGLNGFSYWADFLDLQARGPVSWRKEIEEGIRDAAKVVCFIDKAYLLSFNCLQEIAFALLFNKPIILILTEQGAMDLLTRPDAVLDAWGSSDLQRWQGKPLTPDYGDGTPLTLDEVTRIYEVLASINFCMCRSMDFENDTERVVLRRVYDFVSAELEYQKEHALLQTRALEWEQSGEDPARLPKKNAVLGYRGWIQQAKAHHQIPAPTELQERYVRQGELRALQARRLLKILVSVVLVVVSGLAIMMAIQWQDATRQRAFADQQRELALEQAHIAETQTRVAVTQTALAEEKALVASTQLFLFHAKTDKDYNGYSQAAMRDAMEHVDRLPESVRVEVMEQRTFMAHELRTRTVGYPLARLTPDVPTTGYFGSGGVSPGLRWAVQFSVFGQLDLYDLSTKKFVTSKAIEGHIVAPIDWIDDDIFVVSGYFVDLSSPDASVEKIVRLKITVVPDEAGGYAMDLVNLRTSGHDPDLDVSRYVDPDSLATQVLWSYSSDHRRVLLAFVQSSKVGIFDQETGVSEMLIHAPGEPIAQVDVSRSGRKAMAAVGDQIHVWDLESGSETHTLQLGKYANEAFFSPDGEQIATRTLDGEMEIWSTTDPTQRRKLPGLSRSPVKSVIAPMAAWSPDGRWIAAVVTGEECLVQDVSGEEEVVVVVATGTSPQYVEWGSDSKHLFFFDTDGSVTVAYLEDSVQGAMMEGHTGDVISMGWSQDGQQLLSTSRQDQTVRVFDAADGSNRVLLSGREFVSADWSPDDARAAAIDNLGVLTMVDVAGGSNKILGTHPLSDAFESDYKTGKYEIAWSRHKNLVASVQDTDGLLLLWDPNAAADQPPFESIKLFPEHEGMLTVCTAPSWGNAAVAVACLTSTFDGFNVEVAVVNADDRSVQHLLHGQYIGNHQSIAVAFASDGNALAVAGIEHVGLWERDPTTNAWEFRKLRGSPGTATDIAWSRDGKQLISASQDSRVLEWELDTASCGFARAVARDLQGNFLRVSVGRRVGEDGREEQVLAATDGAAIRVIGEDKSDSELILRQSQGVTHEALLVHYNIKEGDTGTACSN